MTTYSTYGPIDTPWIDAQGVEDIMRSAGFRSEYFTRDVVASRDRREYVADLVSTIIYTIARRSANPAALVDGPEEDGLWNELDYAIKKLGEDCANQMEATFEKFI